MRGGKDDFRQPKEARTSNWKSKENARPDVSPALEFELRRIDPALERRKEIGSLRILRPFHKVGTIDFSSNDYLGLAQSQEQHNTVERIYGAFEGQRLLGSTGSRLLTGDSEYAQTLENRLAKWHKRPAALLCNSGYDANLSVLSCLTLDTVVLMDELSHNSLQMGVRLSKNCEVELFRHNDLQHLQDLLRRYCRQTSKPILVVVESVYSMDGDIAPLKEVLDLSLQYNACVIVDEAHGLGVFGPNGMGVLERDSLEDHPSLLCSVHTFGKAAGCHGAVVCGSKRIKQFLLNYGRPIIYSTSLPLHSLVTIACSYQTMAGATGKQLRQQVMDRIAVLRQGMNRIMEKTLPTISLVDSDSPIQALVVPGNNECAEFCQRLWTISNQRIRLYPIRSPTVPKGQERVRIICHSHNSQAELSLLLDCIERTLVEMGLLQPKSKL